MGLLEFGLLCIDFLAWPMLALAYPLCASIRAIETGSKDHMRKLVTYWTVFSMISLFEHTLKAMEWVPLWPYVKLICTFWLVIPQFNGACYAYDCLVSANMGVKLHCILSQFNSALYAHKRLVWSKNKLNLHMQGINTLNSVKAGELAQNLQSKDDASILLMEETRTAGNSEKAVGPVHNLPESVTSNLHLGETKTAVNSEKTGGLTHSVFKDATSTPYIEDTRGATNCEKAGQLSHKLSMGTKSNFHMEVVKSAEKATEVIPNKFKDIKAMEQTTEQETEERKVKSAADNIGEIEKKEIEATGVKGMPLPETAEDNIVPEISSSKLVQTEWTCAVCQVTTTSENDLKSHLRGMRHRTKCMELKPIKWIPKGTGSFPPKATDRPNQVKNEPAKHAPAGGGSKQETTVKPEKATGLSNKGKNEPANYAPAGGGSKQKITGKQEKVQANASGKKERNVKENNASVGTDSTLYCGFCNIWCSREIDMASHLKGRKHLSKLEQMGILMENETPYCSFCNIWCPGQTGVASHLKGRKHLSKLNEMGILMG